MVIDCWSVRETLIGLIGGREAEGPFLHGPLDCSIPRFAGRLVRTLVGLAAPLYEYFSASQKLAKRAKADSFGSFWFVIRCCLCSYSTFAYPPLAVLDRSTPNCRRPLLLLVEPLRNGLSAMLLLFSFISSPSSHPMGIIRVFPDKEYFAAVNVRRLLSNGKARL